MVTTPTVAEAVALLLGVKTKDFFTIPLGETLKTFPPWTGVVGFLIGGEVDVIPGGEAGILLLTTFGFPPAAENV